MYENKEEALRELNKIIDEYGIGYNELKENYNSGKTVNTKKKDKVRIRLLSQNEAILKLMVPYGNKQNMNATYSYPYPWQISEGKYGFRHYLYGYIDWYGVGQRYQNQLVNRIDPNKFNNLYEYTYSGTNAIGLISQNANWIRFDTRSNGYALCYQDNYEDKPEIRVHTYYEIHPWQSTAANKWRRNNYYSKNGDAVNAGQEIYSSFDTDDLTTKWTQVYTTTYKTSTMQYQGMWPVLSVAS